MVAISHTLALVAASLFTMAVADTTSVDLSWTSVVTSIATPTVTKPANAMSTIGCFETGIPLQNYGSYQYQSAGNCQFICLQLDKDVLGVSDGENCWCGDQIPAKEWKINDDLCSTSCSGDNTSNCGGKNRLWVILTGNTRNDPDWYEPPAISSSSSSASVAASSTAAPQTSSAAPTSVAETPSATASSKPKETGPNTTAIAIGVVVGIVGLAAIIGGVLFFLRRRRQRQAEEDYRRNAANVDNFVSGGKLHTSNSSMNDSRLDPIFVDRRQSNGSIADNEDYSRRILKVTNV